MKCQINSNSIIDLTKEPLYLFYEDCPPIKITLKREPKIHINTVTIVTNEKELNGIEKFIIKTKQDIEELLSTNKDVQEGEETWIKIKNTLIF